MINLKIIFKIGISMIILFVISSFVSSPTFINKVQAQTVTPVTLVSSFNPVSANPPTGTEFTVKVQVKPSPTINIQLYEFKLIYDRTKLEVTGINYLVGQRSTSLGGDGGDVTSLAQIRMRDYIRLGGEIVTLADGYPLSSSADTALAEVTFKASAQTRVTLDISSRLIRVFPDSGRLEYVSVPEATLSVNSGVVSTPTPTPTPTPSPSVLTRPVVTGAIASAPGSQQCVSSSNEISLNVSWISQQVSAVEISNIIATGNPPTLSGQVFRRLVSLGEQNLSVARGDQTGFREVSGSNLGTTTLTLQPGQTYYVSVVANTQRADPLSFTTPLSCTAPSPQPGAPSQPVVGNITGCGATFDASIVSSITPAIAATTPVDLEFKIGGSSEVVERFSGGSINKTFRELGFRLTPGSYRMQVCYTRTSQPLCSNPSRQFDIPVCASPTPTPTPTGVACTQKPTGDANGDGTTDLKDFNIWRNEKFGPLLTKSADFNCNTRVDDDAVDGDLGIWFRNFQP